METPASRDLSVMVGGSERNVQETDGNRKKEVEECQVQDQLFTEDR